MTKRVVGLVMGWVDGWLDASSTCITVVSFLRRGYSVYRVLLWEAAKVHHHTRYRWREEDTCCRSYYMRTVEDGKMSSVLSLESTTRWEETRERMCQQGRTLKNEFDYVPWQHRGTPDRRKAM